MSLAASGKLLSGEYPLDSLVDGCAEYFGLDALDCVTSEAGKYVAVAKVFSSQKVEQDLSVRLHCENYFFVCSTWNSLSENIIVRVNNKLQLHFWFEITIEL